MSERDGLSRSEQPFGAASGSAAVATADGRATAEHTVEHRAAPHRPGFDPLFGVRTADIEPYIGLRYLSKLFRLIAILMVLLLLAEVVTGIARQGVDAIPTLVAEVSRLIVLAGLLWGIGDLVLLLIDMGHDIRATRILVSRQTAHATQPTTPATTHEHPATPHVGTAPLPTESPAEQRR